MMNKPKIALSRNGNLYFCWVPFSATHPYVGYGVDPKHAYDNWKKHQPEDATCPHKGPDLQFLSRELKRSIYRCLACHDEVLHED
jgi:hypothetical protein